MFYINRRADRQTETVDQFPTRKEAFAMLREYAAADRAGDYYVSRRPCRDWLDTHTTNRQIKQMKA